MNQAELEQLLASYPDILTVEDIATILRVHPRSIQRWAQQGRVASVRVGRSYRIPRSEVLRWMLAASTSVDVDVPLPVEPATESAAELKNT